MTKAAPQLPAKVALQISRDARALSWMVRHCGPRRHREAYAVALRWLSRIYTRGFEAGRQAAIAEKGNGHASKNADQHHQHTL